MNIMNIMNQQLPPDDDDEDYDGVSMSANNNNKLPLNFGFNIIFDDVNVGLNDGILVGFGCIVVVGD